MQTDAIIFENPGKLSVGAVGLSDPGVDDAVVDMLWSGISTGTEKLLWTGRMPWFPGLEYPLVPGYEGVGTVVEAGGTSSLGVGQRVFVPGANCFTTARGLFGASAARVVVPTARLTPVDESLGERAVLLSLAATAQHAIASSPSNGPTLIVGHGVVGRLIARLLMARGDDPPTVWERSPERLSADQTYRVISQEAEECRDYATVFDASGDPTIIDAVVPHLRRGGEIVLAGFYADPVSFVFPPAFMREARFRIAAEWRPDDLTQVMHLLEQSALSLDGLISHHAQVCEAAHAYDVAFTDPRCTKMIFSWRN